MNKKIFLIFPIYLCTLILVLASCGKSEEAPTADRFRTSEKAENPDKALTQGKAEPTEKNRASEENDVADRIQRYSGAVISDSGNVAKNEVRQDDDSHTGKAMQKDTPETQPNIGTEAPANTIKKVGNNIVLLDKDGKTLESLTTKGTVESVKKDFDRICGNVSEPLPQDITSYRIIRASGEYGVVEKDYSMCEATVHTKTYFVIDLSGSGTLIDISSGLKGFGLGNEVGSYANYDLVDSNGKLTFRLPNDDLVKEDGDSPGLTLVSDLKRFGWKKSGKVWEKTLDIKLALGSTQKDRMLSKFFKIQSGKLYGYDPTVRQWFEMTNADAGSFAPVDKDIGKDRNGWLFGNNRLSNEIRNAKMVGYGFWVDTRAEKVFYNVFSEVLEIEGADAGSFASDPYTDYSASNSICTSKSERDTLGYFAHDRNHCYGNPGGGRTIVATGDRK